MIKTALTLSVGLLSLAAQAQMSPVGLWRSIDDATQQPKAEIRITQKAGGGLSGVVERSLATTPSTEPNCNLCTDDRKGQPKIGMEIIRGGQQSDGKAVWVRMSDMKVLVVGSCKARGFTAPESRFGCGPAGAHR